MRMSQATSSTVHRRFRHAPVLAALALVAAALVLWSAPSVHGQGTEQDAATLTVAFPGVTIPDKVYTAGADVIREVTGAGDQGLARLPEATVTVSTNTLPTVTYSATGLPAGLWMGSDRVIYGAPVAATASPVAVTYTASVTSQVIDPNTYALTAGPTGSASLTFTVTVNPAVTFDAEAMEFIQRRIVYYSGSGWGDAGSDGNVTFPAASGGTGTITYSLLHNTTRQPLADAADGITFDPATRKLGGTPAQSARRDWAVTYYAEDENGSRAGGVTVVHAGGWGGL